ncbi:MULTISPECIES: hypothetical protein [unclassified Limnohabitans]|jgi:hypothetical protein|uniref:hypothetical protein n=1 Tax=unclassified Limnohabitans TaxID=2626134 RepID=UPI000AA8E96C|nr:MULTISPECIES: hypothetical protein [unclassified Limnohabitans]PUE21116.1 hypothetical protein B9Z48_01360 [Limnohabitans sp. WS1]
MKENKPLVSAQELNALIEGWGETANQQIDKFYPLRFWLIVSIAFIYAFNLLFTPNEIASRLSNEPLEIARLTNFLYFRGWFIILVTAIATYAYLNNWYISIVIFCIFLISSVNFIFDFFTVYNGQIGTPTTLLTAILLLRIFILLLLFFSVKNLSKIPEKKDRMNIFLPFGKKE